jgi:hypothetical protein
MAASATLPESIGCVRCAQLSLIVATLLNAARSPTRPYVSEIEADDSKRETPIRGCACLWTWVIAGGINMSAAASRHAP